MPDMIQVESSNIEAIGFDEELEELTVEFKGGRLYRYDGVKQSVFDDFKMAKSKGVFFATEIKNTYSFTRLS